MASSSHGVRLPSTALDRGGSGRAALGDATRPPEPALHLSGVKGRGQLLTGTHAPEHSAATDPDPAPQPSNTDHTTNPRRPEPTAPHAPRSRPPQRSHDAPTAAADED